MPFELTYALDADGLEFERELMFEEETLFEPHETDALSVEVRTLHLGHNRLCRVSSTGHTITLAEHDELTVLIPRRGRIVIESGGETLSTKPNDMLFCIPDKRTTHVVPDHHGLFVCDCALVSNPASILNTIRKDDARLQNRVYTKSTFDAAAQNLTRYLDYLSTAAAGPANGFSSARSRDAAGVLLEEGIEDLIDTYAGSHPHRALPGAQDHRLVRMAKEIMLEHYADPLSTGDIAGKLGIGARRLQAAFGSVHGMPPLSVFKAIRLDEARTQLQAPRPGATVSSIAMDCGFTHLGRFAADYSEAFGETPVETLRRCRA